MSIGFGSRRNTTSQQAAPPRKATQNVSAPPVARSTLPRALTAPAQSGSSKRAMMVLTHFGMGVFYNVARQLSAVEHGTPPDRVIRQTPCLACDCVSGLLRVERAAVQHYAESSLSVL